MQIRISKQNTPGLKAAAAANRRSASAEGDIAVGQYLERNQARTKRVPGKTSSK